MTEGIVGIYLVIRVVIVVVLMLVGISGNALILVIYIPGKNLPTRLFVITLAIIDLYGVPVNLAMTIPYEQGKIGDAVVFPQIALLQLSYMFTTVAMALDRLLAVFAPFKYKTHRRRMLTTLTIVAGVIVFGLETCLIAAIRNNTYMPVYIALYLSCYCTGLLVVIVVYPAIAVRLYRQGRKIRGAPDVSSLRTVSHAISAQANSVASNANKPTTVTSKHVKTVKLYLAILALFLGSFIPTVIAFLTDRTVLAYLTHVNNVGNVFIYYWFIDSFRTKTKQIFVTLCSKFLANQTKL